MSVAEAIKAVRRGEMVLIYDSEDREAETDMVVPAVSTTPKQVARMRVEAGGLICVAISPQAAERLCLPFMSDILKFVSSNGCSLIPSARSPAILLMIRAPHFQSPLIIGVFGLG